MRRWLWMVVVGLPILVVAWWLGSPLFVDRVADDAFPLAENATVPSSMTRQEVERVMAGMAKVEQVVEETMPPATAPVVLKVGAFRDVDSFHHGTGTATLYRLPDGGLVLRLEQFRVTNGPDLRVLLTEHPSPERREDLETTGYVELNKLKGNVGNQNYVVPDSVDVAGQRSVVIYCRPFHVIFSVATLMEPGA